MRSLKTILKVLAILPAICVAESEEKQEESGFFSKAKGALGKVKESAEKGAQWVGDKAVETADDAVAAAGNAVEAVKENPLVLLDVNPVSLAKNFIAKKGMELYKGRPTFLLDEGQKAFEKGDFLEAMKNFRGVVQNKEASSQQKIAASQGLLSIACIFQDVTVESFDHLLESKDISEKDQALAKKIINALKEAKQNLN